MLQQSCSFSLSVYVEIYYSDILEQYYSNRRFPKFYFSNLTNTILNNTIYILSMVES